MERSCKRWAANIFCHKMIFVFSEVNVVTTVD